MAFAPPPGLRLGLRLKEPEPENEPESNTNNNNTIGLERVNFLEERGAGAHGVVKVEGLRKPGEPLQRVRKSVANNGSPLGNIQLKDIKREIMVYSELKKKEDSKRYILPYSGGKAAGKKGYIEFEYEPGMDLLDFYNKTKPSKAELKRLCLEALQGYAFLYESGFLHGDIKADNVYISTKTEKPHALLYDFGKATRSLSYSNKLDEIKALCAMLFEVLHVEAFAKDKFRSLIEYTDDGDIDYLETLASIRSTVEKAAASGGRRRTRRARRTRKAT